MNQIKVILFLTITSLFISSCSQNKEPTKKLNTTCPTNGIWCESKNKKIAILFPIKIPYLKPFPLKVRIKNAKSEIKNLQVQFSMQGMQMGMNNFNFKLKQKDNDYQYWSTTVILPICVAGRKDWMVEINRDNTSNFYLIKIKKQIYICVY